MENIFKKQTIKSTEQIIESSAPIIESNEKIVESTNPWGNTTDPKNHDSKKFRYLIHGIKTNQFASSMLQMFNMKTSLEKNTIEENKKYGDQSINLLNCPEKVSDRISLSMSLIDQDHIGTWGNIGLILEVPECNIIKNSFSDLGSLNCEYNHLLQVKKYSYITNPDELLKCSNTNSYNEVVAFANFNENKIKLIGFFYNTTSDGNPLDEVNFNKIKNHASRLNLPLIQIKQKSIYSENKIDKSENDFWLKFNNKMYTFIGDGKSKFYVRNEKYESYSISPSELETICNFLKENNYSQIEIDKIKEEYQQYDLEYHKPSINFNDKGEISWITLKKGYGENETTYTIGSNGCSESITAKNLWLYMNDSGNYDKYKQNLSKDMQLSLINEIKPQFDQETKEKLEKFAKKIESLPEYYFNFCGNSNGQRR